MNAAEASMANGNVDIACKEDWPLANPWLWLVAGLGLTVWSWLWAVAFGERASDGRVIVLALGLLIAAGGLWLRWQDRQTVFFAGPAPLLRLALGGLFALLGLGATGFFLYTCFYRVSGYTPAAMFVVWIASAPLAFLATRRAFTLNAADRERDAPSAEISLAFVVAAGICLLGSFTLYLGRSLASDWDTIRLVLRVLAAVALYAAALVVVSTGPRRLILSLLVVLHFAGISTAVLSAPPSPWLVQQAWVRVFRPYLEFMYLNNAYHFYAPEPGPTSYLWFRIIYADPNEPNAEYGMWFKIPQIDDHGRIKHPVALEYQRFMSLTESVAAVEPTPPPIYTNPAGEWGIPPIYKRRLALLPTTQVIVGERPGPYFKIPTHPQMPQNQQLMIPNDHSRRLYQSFARFVARKFAVHPEHPEWKFKSVKIYRVIHSIPPAEWIRLRIPPNDPQLYLPYFMGNFDAQGKVVDEDDPYLFWLLPIKRDTWNDPISSIRDYARLHAGDERWFRPRGSKVWETDRIPQRVSIP